MVHTWTEGQKYKILKTYSLVLDGHSMFLNASGPETALPEHFSGEAHNLVKNGVLEPVGVAPEPVEAPLEEVAEEVPAEEVAEEFGAEEVQAIVAEAVPEEKTEEVPEVEGFPCRNPECPSGRNVGGENGPYTAERYLTKHLAKSPDCSGFQ